jgi:hypothetical protein
VGNERNELKASARSCFIYAIKSRRVRHIAARLSCHTRAYSSCPDSQVDRIHHTIRPAIRTEMNPTKIRVARFEIVKQRSNSAMKKTTILSVPCNVNESKVLGGRNDVRPHKQCPWKTENNGHWFKTEDSGVLWKRYVAYYHHMTSVGTHVECDLSTHRTG